MEGNSAQQEFYVVRITTKEGNVGFYNSSLNNRFSETIWSATRWKITDLGFSEIVNLYIRLRSEYAHRNIEILKLNASFVLTDENTDLANTTIIHTALGKLTLKEIELLGVQEHHSKMVLEK